VGAAEGDPGIISENDCGAASCVWRTASPRKAGRPVAVRLSRSRVHLETASRRCLNLQPLRKQRYEAVATIKAQAQGKADSAILKQTLERYYAATDGLTTLHQQRRELFRQTLTPEQQAKFMILRFTHRHHDKRHQTEGSQKQG